MSACQPPTQLPDSTAAVLKLYSMLPPPSVSSSKPLPAFVSDPLALSDIELLDKARHAHGGAEFAAQYDQGAFSGSQSEADLSLCNKLAFWLGRDPARMDAAFRASALMRGKWDEKRGAATYGEKTLAAAIEGTSETYTPRTSTRPTSNGTMSNGAPKADGHQVVDVASSDPEALTWKPVLPVAEMAVRPFPLEIFPAWAREYLQAVTDCLRTPPDFAGMWFLSLLALCAQKRYLLQVKAGWMEQLVLWIIVAAWSGTRKSPAFKLVFDPAVQWNQRMEEEFSRIRKRALRDFKNLEAEIDALRKKKGDPDLIRQKEDELDEIVIPPIPKLFAGTATPERVETALMEQLGRFGLASAESDVLAMMLGKYRNGGPPPIEVFLSAWSGDDIDSEYQGKGNVKARAPHLSQGLGTQPDNLHDFFNQKKLGPRGTFGRFLPAAPFCEICEDWDTGTIDPAVAAQYCSNVLKLAPSLIELETAYTDGKFDSRSLRFGASATKVFRPFYKSVQRRRQDGGDLRFNDEWSAKIAGQTARIAALLHLCEHPGREVPAEIGEAPVKRAVALAEEYLIPMAKKVFGRQSILPKLQKLWANILSFDTTEVKRTLLGQSFPMSGDDIDTGLEMLEEHNFIRVERRRTGTRGPLSQIIVVRPNPPKTVSGVSGVSANGVKPLFQDEPTEVLEFPRVSGVSATNPVSETPENSRITPEPGVSSDRRLETEVLDNSRNSRNSRQEEPLDELFGDGELEGPL